MNDEEQKQYIDIYSITNNVSKEQAKAHIDNSIEIAYNEIIENAKAKTTQNEYKSNYSELIKFYGNQSVSNLKNIYANMDVNNSASVEEFNQLYQALSSLSKLETNSLEEEQIKLAQLQDLSNKIEQLSIGNNQKNNCL